MNHDTHTKQHLPTFCSEQHSRLTSWASLKMEETQRPQAHCCAPTQERVTRCTGMEAHFLNWRHLQAAQPVVPCTAKVCRTSVS